MRRESLGGLTLQRSRIFLRFVEKRPVVDEVILFRTLSLREEIPPSKKFCVTYSIVTTTCIELGYDLETRFQPGCIYRLIIALYVGLVMDRWRLGISEISMPRRRVNRYTDHKYRDTCWYFIQIGYVSFILSSICYLVRYGVKYQLK